MKLRCEYLLKKYSPSAMIVYGSYADGTRGEDSDFDALMLVDENLRLHDTEMVGGVRLDVFVYPFSVLTENFAPEEFLQILDGKILLDARGEGAKLMAAVQDYVQSLPKKTPEENLAAVRWCEKMLVRASRGDAEGFYRWHWLLTDSLEIYCDLRGWLYRGPKKTLARMQCEDRKGAALCHRAMTDMNACALEAWVRHLGGLI